MKKPILIYIKPALIEIQCPECNKKIHIVLDDSINKVLKTKPLDVESIIDRKHKNSEDKECSFKSFIIRNGELEKARTNQKLMKWLEDNKEKYDPKNWKFWKP